jgi:predicted DCC family thiol-disulfide oxidoreductase YuxK
VSSDPLTTSLSSREPDVVFFDGVCGLCNRSVDFILRHDRRGAMLVSPLQGETAQQRLDPADREQLGSLVLWTDGRTYRRSAAVARILWRLGPLWKTAGAVLWLIPLPFRDLGYRLIASNRYRLFGKKETCRLPTEAERARFLP